MRSRTKRFIADLWFVLALLMPLFGAIALAMACEPDTGWTLLEVALAGPVALARRSPGWEAPLFVTCCALPTAWLALEALALRASARSGGLRVASAAWVARVGLLGGVSHLVGAAPAPALVVVCALTPALLWGVGAALGRGRGIGFEITLGVMLSERTILPCIAWALIALGG